MKTVLRPVLGLLLAMGLSGPASAANLTRDELISRLRLRADILVLSDDGKRLVAVGDESRVLSGFSPEGKFKRDWSSTSTISGTFRLRHEWSVDPAGVIHVRFEEFSEEEMDSKTGQTKSFKNPIGTEERDVVDFGVITYPVKAIRGKRVVVRFIPELAAEDRVETIGKLKLLGRGISIFDSEGMVWASDLQMSAEYTAISTHRGTLILSYSPFKGAEPAGIAAGKKITIRMKDYPRITVQSETDFVPEGLNARVFVKYMKERRTEALNSVKQSESSSESKLLERLK